MQDRKWIPFVLVGLIVGYAVHSYMTPNRPILNALKGLFKTAIFVAPFVLDEPQPYEGVASTYGAMPNREVGADGYAVIEHGENW